MPFHDLNITYSPDDSSLSSTLAFLAELGYTTAALSVNITSKLPSQLPTIPLDRIQLPLQLSVQTRVTLTISDTSQNHRINNLNSTYDLVALRPTTEKNFQLCCAALDCDLISLDLTNRLPFPIRFKTVASALQRGVRFEINYSPGIVGSSDARRNLISGAASLIRATRGRGIILSSEARTALGLRGPHDVINLATVWGLSAERGKESICDEAGRVVRLAGIKRSSFRGVVDVVEDGSNAAPIKADKPQDDAATESYVEQQEIKTQSLPPLKQVTVVPDKSGQAASQAKRKASQASLNDKGSEQQNDSATKPLSKREMKRQAKKARLDRAAGKHEQQDTKDKGKQKANGFPIQHEILATKENG